MKVKLFTQVINIKRKFACDSTSLANFDLENDINTWLGSQPGIEIKKITQTQSGGSLMPSVALVTVWYND